MTRGTILHQTDVLAAKRNTIENHNLPTNYSHTCVTYGMHVIRKCNVLILTLLHNANNNYGCTSIRSVTQDEHDQHYKTCSNVAPLCL